MKTKIINGFGENNRPVPFMQYLVDSGLNNIFTNDNVKLQKNIVFQLICESVEKSSRKFTGIDLTSEVDIVNAVSEYAGIVRNDILIYDVLVNTPIFLVFETDDNRTYTVYITPDYKFTNNTYLVNKIHLEFDLNGRSFKKIV